MKKAFLFFSIVLFFCLAKSQSVNYQKKKKKKKVLIALFLEFQD